MIMWIQWRFRQVRCNCPADWHFSRFPPRAFPIGSLLYWYPEKSWSAHKKLKYLELPKIIFLIHETFPAELLYWLLHIRLQEMHRESIWIYSFKLTVRLNIRTTKQQKGQAVEKGLWKIVNLLHTKSVLPHPAVFMLLSFPASVCYSIQTTWLSATRQWDWSSCTKYIVQSVADNSLHITRGVLRHSVYVTRET